MVTIPQISSHSVQNSPSRGAVYKEIRKKGLIFQEGFVIMGVSADADE